MVGESGRTHHADDAVADPEEIEDRLCSILLDIGAPGKHDGVGSVRSPYKQKWSDGSQQVSQKVRSMCRFLLVAALLCSLDQQALAQPDLKPHRPNVVILLADDLGFADVGFQGCKDIPTPNLDDLARGGVRCTNGYVSGPYCSPTRAGLMTGRYQCRYGNEFNPGAQAGHGLAITETTMAERLKSIGYATGLVGKWHLGEAPRFRPQRRGFGDYFGFLAGAHPYFPGRGAPIFRGAQQVDESQYLTDAFGREAVDFIERHKKEPFFLYLAFNAVHTPMQATEDRLQKFASVQNRQRRTYAAMTWAMDEAVGRVLAKLRQEKLEEDTLIFFFSDNGGPTMQGTTINGSINAPLRGSKRTTLEGGIHVPFVVTWKGTLPGGKTYDAPIIQLDILPTALAAAGAQVKPEWKLDGVDLLPYLQGKNLGVPHDTLYWRFGEQMALRQGDWKLVRYDPTADGDPNAGKATPTKLYNLAADIGEKNDLAAMSPDKVKELQAIWDKWNAGLVRPLWGPGALTQAEVEQ
jgi:arylsulfatase A-like enzyme